MSSLVNVIIPACGNGSRFGSETPKHLIDIAGRPMVAWVIEHLPYFCKVYVIVRPEQKQITEWALQKYKNTQVFHTTAYTRGACETVMAPPLDNDIRVMVVNCDNIIQPIGGWNLFLTEHDNAIVTFIESNKNIQPPPFSYAKVQDGRIVEVAEKVRISRHACAGAFLFKDFFTLRMLCKWHLELDQPDVGFEHYLAPIYNRLIDDPMSRVHNVSLGRDGVFIRMGTPIEAADARKELSRVYGSKRQ